MTSATLVAFTAWAQQITHKAVVFGTTQKATTTPNHH